MLVTLKQDGSRYVPEYFLRASRLTGNLGEDNNPEWKTLAFDELSGDLVAPNGSVGFRWGQSGKWNLEARGKRRP